MGKDDKKKSEAREERSRGRSEDGLVAKKDFEIHHNGYHLSIKVDDDLSKVPALYLPNLRTEGVL